MKVLLFGATGMVGQGVLRECLLAPDVEMVEIIVRAATGLANPKLRETVRKDFYDYSDAEAGLRGFDACFFCLGVTSAGKSEAEYTRLTYDLTLAAAQTLARLNPQMTFVYVSGQATDSSEKGRVMWARVKGRTENAILALPFKAAYMFRPGAIQAMHGERPKVSWMSAIYSAFAPFLSLLRLVFPDRILTTEQIGKAMLNGARRQDAKTVAETRDILALSAT
jgi:uncharacterized protein YbjT (DUF2867 family)